MIFQETREFLWAASAFYALALVSGFVGAQLLQKNLFKQLTLVGIIVGFVLQTQGLYLRGLLTNGCPLGNGLERAQFITWSLILAFLILRLLWKLNLLGSFCSGAAALLGSLSLLRKDWDHPYWSESAYTRLFSDPWVELHASLAVFSYGIFALLAIVSAMYLMQRKSLLSKKSGLWGALFPPIHDLEQAAQRLLLIGTLFLTLSIIVGGMHWAHHPERVTSVKLFITLLLWIGYCILFFLRYRNFLFGSKFSQASITLFLIAVISMGFVNSRQKKALPVESPEIQPVQE